MSATILEKFLYLFVIDADQIKQGAEKAKPPIEGLKKSLSSVDSVSQKLNTSFGGLAKRLGGIVLAFASVSSAINGIKSAAHVADQIENLSDITGESAENISVWGDAVQKSGGSAEGFHETLKSVTASLTDFATKGKSRVAPFFQELGIKMVDSRGKARKFLDILPELADSFQRVSKAESLGIGQKLGLDEGTINLLQKGRVGVEEIIRKQKELGVVTKQDTEIAAKFKNQWDDTKIVFRSVFLGINTIILPVLTKLGEMFEKVGKFARKHSDFIVAALTSIAVTLTVVLLPAIVATIAGFAPFILIAGIIGTVATAIGLIYDDIQHFRKGNASLIGEIIKKWPLVATIFIGLKDALVIVWDIAKGFFTFLYEAASSPTRAWENFKKVLIKAWDDILAKFPIIKTAFTEVGNWFIAIGNRIKMVFDGIATAIKSVVGFIMGAIDKVIGAYTKVKNFVTGDSTIKASVSAGQSALTTANETPLASQSINSITNASRSLSRHTNVKVGDVIINTPATDIKSISQDASKSLEVQIRQAQDSADNGVKI